MGPLGVPLAQASEECDTTPDQMRGASGWTANEGVCSCSFGMAERDAPPAAKLALSATFWARSPSPIPQISPWSQLQHFALDTTPKRFRGFSAVNGLHLSNKPVVSPFYFLFDESCVKDTDPSEEMDSFFAR